jgi:8-oxo-dGTP pyrophosphatase MutT (NUDIX family)
MLDTSSPILQAGTIPYRMLPSRIEYCLVTSARTGRWGFPKGVIDPGETSEDTALKESWEEAGLHGQLMDQPLGSYAYRKWQRSLSVEVYLMHVTDEAAVWPEATSRQRKWMTFAEAWQQIERAALRLLLEQAHDRLNQRAGGNRG